jgi:hypothetical protein
MTTSAQNSAQRQLGVCQNQTWAVAISSRPSAQIL